MFQEYHEFVEQVLSDQDVINTGAYLPCILEFALNNLVSGMIQVSRLVNDERALSTKF